MRPLLPAGASRTVGIAVLGCAVFTAWPDISGHANGDTVDAHVDSWIISQLGSHGHGLQLAADLGQGPQVAVMTCALIVACLAVRRATGALLALISVPVAAGLTEYVLKPIFDQNYSSFPSGHSTGIFAVVAVVAVLVADPPRARLRAARIVIVLAGVVVGCAVAVATIGLGFHDFIEAVGGAVVGTGVVLATTFVLDLAVSLAPARRPSARSGSARPGAGRSCASPATNHRARPSSGHP